ncbi:Uncharacterised protein [Segatella oris]|uniref:Uncharacterized protein n=3 Tax=root TaxID=1 RepID=A0A448L267_9BACT|nr:Uncharacterised protein [Segatella oris]
MTFAFYQVSQCDESLDSLSANEPTSVGSFDLFTFSIIPSMVSKSLFTNSGREYSLRHALPSTPRYSPTLRWLYARLLPFRQSHSAPFPRDRVTGRAIFLFSFFCHFAIIMFELCLQNWSKILTLKRKCAMLAYYTAMLALLFALLWINL